MREWYITLNLTPYVHNSIASLICLKLTQSISSTLNFSGGYREWKEIRKKNDFLQKGSRIIWTALNEEISRSAFQSGNLLAGSWSNDWWRMSKFSLMRTKMVRGGWRNSYLLAHLTNRFQISSFPFPFLIVFMVEERPAGSTSECNSDGLQN